MRTVHEPEPPKSAAVNGALIEPTPPSKKSIKLKLANGSKTAPRLSDLSLHPGDDLPDPDPKAKKNNIVYAPAFHPVTGQAGFVIKYPEDILFSHQECEMPADQLLRLLRRQVHWAMQEGEDLKKELEEMEQEKREEWIRKEILLEGVLDSELALAKREGILGNVSARVQQAMEDDAAVGKHLSWSGGEPSWRRELPAAGDADDDVAILDPAAGLRSALQRTPSPPLASATGEEFDVEQDPYDNILAGQMAVYEERERLRSLGNTPAKTPTIKQQQTAEADAVGALLDMGKP